jgi:hypothetical protein
VSSDVPETTATISFGLELSDREKLLSITANEPYILDVLDIAGGWWIAWQDQYPGAKDLQARQTVRDYVKVQLMDKAPVAVAAGLICIVMSLQHLRVGIDDHDLRLSQLPSQLVHNIAVAVDQVILSKDVYTHSMMGVQLLILKAKQHADSNQLRKSWLRIRQAIQIAQKIDLAKPMPGMSSTEVLGRQRFMGSMFETDRFMSLLLGLPYAFDDNFTDRLATEVIGDHPDISTRARALRRISAIASGHVNDRNASADPVSVALTDTIQQTLTGAAASLPFSWWNVQSHAADLSDPMLSHEHLLTQLWFYQTQALLQLPFMLKAASDPSFESSRITCLNSCRSIITIFNTLRANPVLSAYTCKCEDFQGLLGAIILLVGLLHYEAQGFEPSESSFEEDLDLVETTKQTFRYARQHQGGNIAKQGLHVLDTLSSFLEGPQNGTETPRNATLFVPYFGTISIQAGKIWKPRDEVSTCLTAVETGNFSISETPDLGDFEQGVSEAYPSKYAQPSEEEYRWLDDQAASQATNDAVETTFDWDKMLIGPELNQNWDFLLTSTTAGF